MRLLLTVLALFWAVPAPAAVTVTFWSHELGNDFPHAFLTFTGTPDAGGPPVSASYGFTAKSVTPAILWGRVKSRMDVTKPGYLRTSDAQFAVTITDAQYAALLALVHDWSDNRVAYDLGTANCIHFTREAARLLGLTGLDHPKLMRRPRSYLQAVAAANPGRVLVLREHGREWVARQAPPFQAAVQPPSTDRLAPVIDAASSRQR